LLQRERTICNSYVSEVFLTASNGYKNNTGVLIIICVMEYERPGYKIVDTNFLNRILVGIYLHCCVLMNEQFLCSVVVYILCKIKQRFVGCIPIQKLCIYTIYR